MLKLPQDKPFRINKIKPDTSGLCVERVWSMDWRRIKEARQRLCKAGIAGGILEIILVFLKVQATHAL